jgi:hypothetical protein
MIGFTGPLLQLHLIITVHTLNSFWITNLSLYFFWISDWSLASSLLLLNTTACQCQSQSHSHIATDGRSVSKSWCRAPFGAHDQIFITVWQLRFCGAPSLTRGRVCRLQLLLVLAFYWQPMNYMSFCDPVWTANRTHTWTVRLLLSACSLPR